MKEQLTLSECLEQVSRHCHDPATWGFIPLVDEGAGGLPEATQCWGTERA